MAIAKIKQSRLQLKQRHPHGQPYLCPLPSMDRRHQIREGEAEVANEDVVEAIARLRRHHLLEWRTDEPLAGS